MTRKPPPGDQTQAESWEDAAEAQVANPTMILDDTLEDCLFAEGDAVDHFQVIRLLGRGGMGEVYLARDTTLRRKVALKVIRPELLGDEERVERFLFEARATARLNHPHIVTIHAVGEHHGIPYLALEYVEGPNLRSRMTERWPDTRETIELGKAVAEALQGAHKSAVLHRDLKPENIILSTDGRVRVVDFGLAKRFDDDADASNPALSVEELTDWGEFESLPRVKGTPRFMAPEQWQRHECTPATDVWALGVLMFELCQRELPFDDSTVVNQAVAVCNAEPAPRAAKAPDGLADLVAACLQKTPADRPSAAEVVASLETLLAEQPATPPEPPPETQQPVWPFLLVVALVFVGFAAATGMFDSSPAPTAQAPPEPVAQPVPVAEPTPEPEPEPEPEPAVEVAAEPTPRRQGDPTLSPRRTRRPADEDITGASIALRVTTKPADAEITLAGRPLGKTPLHYRLDAVATPMALTISKDGYKTVTKELVADRDQQLHFKLRRGKRTSKPTRLPTYVD